MKKIISIIFAVVLLSLTCCNSLALEYSLQADTEFDYATPSLSTRKDVTYSAATYEEKKSLSVTSCWLEEKIDGQWVYVCSLPAPEKVNTNAFGYTALMDYSAYIGKGTFRVGAVFDADGHSISRYSNTRTFSK